jgi:hypothetical protein
LSLKLILSFDRIAAVLNSIVFLKLGLLNMSKQKIGMIALLGLLATGCGGPSIETEKEPVLGAEKHKLTGYPFSNREKTVNAGFVLSCKPSSKNLNVLNGSVYFASLSNEYTFDDNVKLFLEIDGIRHSLNIINRSQSTGEVGKSFFKSTRVYVTTKALSFDLDASLLTKFTASSNIKIILAREIGNTTKENVDILTLYPDEFDAKHYQTIEKFIEKCTLKTKI